MATVMLTTSDIQVATYQGNELVSMTSTERLEKAIALGHKVVVFTTRQKLVDTDQWWVDLVGRENVFLASPPTRDPLSFQIRPDDYSSGWKMGFQALDIAWPTMENGDPAFWTSVTPALRAAGILTRDDI